MTFALRMGTMQMDPVDGCGMRHARAKIPRKRTGEGREMPLRNARLPESRYS